jgi:hypothetical protein
MDTTDVRDGASGYLAAPQPDGDGYTGVDRRRPGRPQDISPHLVALLRPDDRDTPPVFQDDAQRAVVGLGAAVLLSLPLWIMLGVIVWALWG